MQGVYCQFVVERRTHEVVGSLAAGKKIKRKEKKGKEREKMEKKKREK